MASSQQSLTTALRCIRSNARGQLLPLEQQLRVLRLRDSRFNARRYLSLDSDRPPNSNFAKLQEAAIIQAASEIDLDGPAAPRLQAARPVPLSPSYFSRTPFFNDRFLAIEKMIRSYGNLPIIPSSEVERVVWKSQKDYKQWAGEEVKASDYGKCIKLVKRLHQIHPVLKPKAVAMAIKPFMREVQAFANKPAPIPIDQFGRALGVGRRKSSIARAWVVEGTGEVQVNGKTLADYFGRVHDRESAVWALHSTSRLDKYNVWALVEGGGTTGQAEALTLAIAKGLVAHEPALKTPLRKAGCITRDPRRVERKKAGHVKARKMPAWVKR